MSQSLLGAAHIRVLAGVTVKADIGRPLAPIKLLEDGQQMDSLLGAAPRPHSAQSQRRDIMLASAGCLQLTFSYGQRDILGFTQLGPRDGGRQIELRHGIRRLHVSYVILMGAPILMRQTGKAASIIVL